MGVGSCLLFLALSLTCCAMLRNAPSLSVPKSVKSTENVKKVNV